MRFFPFMRKTALVLSFCVAGNALAATSVVVNANMVFNPTAVHASAGDVYSLDATGSADLAADNGPYIVNADGTILTAPPVGSGAYSYFTSNAAPVGVPPVVGNKKNVIPTFLPAHLIGAPYGALVAGFSSKSNPTAYADFPNGFALVGASGFATAPAGGGYLFLGVNDIENPPVIPDNRGGYNVQIQLIPEPAAAALLPACCLFARRKRSD